MSQRWRVIRQDDNGNQYVIAEVSTEAEPQAIAVELEARAHKQMYWVESIAVE